MASWQLLTDAAEATELAVNSNPAINAILVSFMVFSLQIWISPQPPQKRKLKPAIGP
jgi:hypothetical protein